MRIQMTLIQMILCVTIHSSLATDESSSEQTFTLPDTCEDGQRTGNWKACASSLSTIIWNTHTWYDDQPITVCKLNCSRTLKGHVSNFQWVWDAKFRCEENAPGIMGKARGFKIRREAMQSAIASTIEQAILSSKLTPTDFQC